MLIRREECGRGEIIGNTMRCLGHDVGGGRGDDNEVSGAGQFNMPHLGFVGQIP